MKILYITPDYPPSYGGIGTYTVNTLRAICNDSITIDVLVARMSSQLYRQGEVATPNDKKLECSFNNTEVRELILPYKQSYDIPEKNNIVSLMLVNRAYQEADWRVYEYLIGNYDLTSYDLLISNDLFFGMCGVMISQQYDIPILSLVHLQDQGVIAPMKSYRQFVLSHSSALLSPVRYIHAELEHILGHRKVPLYYAPVNVDIFKNQIKKSGQSEFNILYVGRLVYAKGVDVLLEAIAQMKPSEQAQIKVDLVGDGDYRAELQNFVDRRKLNQLVTFHGQLDREDVNQRYASASVLVVPSRHELLGTVALEGMGHGLPVIASDVGGLSEVLSTDTGILFPNEDAEGLSTILSSCLKKNEQLEQWGYHARNRVAKDNSIEATRTAFYACFDDLLAGRDVIR